MIFGPDFRAVLLPLAITMPIAFALFAAGYYLANAGVRARQSTGRVIAAVVLQWALVIPLQLILGWQLSMWFDNAGEIVWLGVLVFAVPLAGIVASLLVFRHGFLHAILVGVASSLLGLIGSLAVLWMFVKLYARL